jgi:hypothetical protein
MYSDVHNTNIQTHGICSKITRGCLEISRYISLGSATQQASGESRGWDEAGRATGLGFTRLLRERERETHTHFDTQKFFVFCVCGKHALKQIPYSYPTARGQRYEGHQQQETISLRRDKRKPRKYVLIYCGARGMLLQSLFFLELPQV